MEQCPELYQNRGRTIAVRWSFGERHRRNYALFFPNAIKRRAEVWAQPDVLELNPCDQRSSKSSN
jgi:hypothetical protein